MKVAPKVGDRVKWHPLIREVNGDERVGIVVAVGKRHPIYTMPGVEAFPEGSRYQVLVKFPDDEAHWPHGRRGLEGNFELVE